MLITLAAEVACLDFFLHHSYHGEGDTLDEDILAHGVIVAEQIFGDGVAKQTNTAFEGHVGLVEVAAFIGNDVPDVSIFYCHSAHGVEDLLPAVADAAALGETFVGQGCVHREGEDEALSNAAEGLQVLPAYG